MRDVERVQRRDAPLHLDMYRHRFAVSVREVLVDAQVVMDAAAAARSLEHVASVYRLFNQALHPRVYYATTRDVAVHAS